VPHIIEHVRAGSKVATDEGRTFSDLRSEGYWHATVNHSAKEYVRGPVHTNTIEAFWANVKRGIKGTYVHVSTKHLHSYLGEFEFRHNLRRPNVCLPDVRGEAARKRRPSRLRRHQ
jgi:transposase